MGLDMYLYSVPKIQGMTLSEILSAQIHIGEHEASQNEIYQKIKVYIKHFEDKVINRKWRSLLTEIAYWRKANQIHNWFVINVQNGVDECGSYEVSKENVQELYHLCTKILSKRAEPQEVLPTKSGFYFGSTDYDYYYFRELERTQSILLELLNTFNFNTHYLIYNNSW
jgi:hypothetical protein